MYACECPDPMPSSCLRRFRGLWLDIVSACDVEMKFTFKVIKLERVIFGANS